MEQEKMGSYHKSYMPFIIKWGCITSFLMVPAMLLPALLLFIFHGARPSSSGLIAGLVGYVSYSLPWYFTELIAMGPILHIPGTYMGFISGNTRNVRAVAATTALSVTNSKTGTPEATVISAVAVATSIFMGIAVMTVLSLVGGFVLSILPPAVLTALSFLVPALFGAMLMQWLMTDIKSGAILLALAVALQLMTNAGFFAVLPLGGSYAPIVICVISGFVIAKLLHGKEVE